MRGPEKGLQARLHVRAHKLLRAHYLWKCVLATSLRCFFSFIALFFPFQSQVYRLERQLGSPSYWLSLSRQQSSFSSSSSASDDVVLTPALPHTAGTLTHPPLPRPQSTMTCIVWTKSHHNSETLRWIQNRPQPRSPGVRWPRLPSHLFWHARLHHQDPIPRPLTMDTDQRTLTHDYNV